MTETLLIEDGAQSDLGLGSADEQYLGMTRPLIGFPDSLTFRLHSLGERFEPFLALSSVDQPGLEFIVVRPGLLFGDYVFSIEEADADELGLTSAADVDVFVLVTRRRDAVPTVNLMGPLIVNRRTQVATQIVLHDGQFAAAVPMDAKSARAR